MSTNFDATIPFDSPTAQFDAGDDGAVTVTPVTVTATVGVPSSFPYLNRLMQPTVAVPVNDGHTIAEKRISR